MVVNFWTNLKNNDPKNCSHDYSNRGTTGVQLKLYLWPAEKAVNLALTDCK